MTLKKLQEIISYVNDQEKDRTEEDIYYIINQFLRYENAIRKAKENSDCEYFKNTWIEEAENRLNELRNY